MRLSRRVLVIVIAVPNIVLARVSPVPFDHTITQMLAISAATCVVDCPMTVRTAGTTCIDILRQGKDGSFASLSCRSIRHFSRLCFCRGFWFSIGSLSAWRDVIVNAGFGCRLTTSATTFPPVVLRIVACQPFLSMQTDSTTGHQGLPESGQFRPGMSIVSIGRNGVSDRR